MWLLFSLLALFARGKKVHYDLYNSDSLDEIQAGTNVDSAELDSVDDLFQSESPEFDPYMADDSSSEDTDEIAVGRFFDPYMETPEYELDDESVDYEDSEEQVGSSSDEPGMEFDGVFTGGFASDDEDFDLGDLDTYSEDFDLIDSEDAVGDDESDFFEGDDSIDLDENVFQILNEPEDDEADFFELNGSSEDELAVGDSSDYLSDSSDIDEFEVGSEEYSDDIDLYDSSDSNEDEVGSEEYPEEIGMYDSSDSYDEEAVGYDPYSIHYEVEVGDDSDELSDEDIEAFESFPEAIGVLDDDEYEVGSSESDSEDSFEVDIGETSKKDKMLLVYFLKKVLKGLPLPVRVLFVRRFKKRYQNENLRGRMLEIVKKMRGTMKTNIQGAGFRDKLKMMINRIRDRITKHYAASRSLMAAKNLKPKAPAKEEEEKDEEEKEPAPAPKVEEKDAEEKEDKDSKFDGTSTFNGKYPLTKFYGNNPVVVYYVPIIAGGSKDANLDKLSGLPGVSSLRETVKKKLEKLQKENL